MRSAPSRSLAALALACALAASASASEPIYREVTAESGLDFVHFNGMSGRLYYLEVVGSGGALFDYDRDGDLDLFLVQGAMLGDDLAPADATYPWPGPGAPRDRLYRNDLEIGADGSRRVRFVDVTEEAGIVGERYGMGAAVGDVDRDGWPDLYVLNFGVNQLWRNRGDGTFEEVAAARGLADERWSVSATFSDLDGDGWPDLYVAEYLDYSLLAHKTCLTERGEPDYCLPAAYRPVPDRVFRNRGDGTFEDVSERWGVAAAPGNGLGVVSADFDGDGRLDVYVANDQMPNHLWLNRLSAGGGGLVEDGLLAGVALNGDGKAEASMGVDAGDVDGDGALDLFLTHFHREHNTLYRAQGDVWEDATERFGLAAPSYPYTAFGTGFLDFDLDGWLDLVVANGRVTFMPGTDRVADPFALDEPNQLFRNREGRGFEEVGAAGAGPAFARSEVSRAALIGDLDNDGDPDLVITNNSGPARVLLDTGADGRAWLGLRVVEGDPPVDAHGALVTLELEGRAPMVRRVHSDGGYASANDPRVVFGLGDAAPAGLAVRVRWPGGAEERWRGLPAGRYTTLRRGEGEPR
jgi:enediyne biosynthesis protein E4